MHLLSKIYLYLLTSLIAVTAFVFWPAGYDYYEFPKFLGFMLVGVVLFVTFVVTDGWVILKKLPLPIRWFLAMYVAGQLMAFSFSSNHILSFGGSPYRYQGVVTNMMYLVVLICAVYFFYISQKKEVFSLFKWVGLTAFVAGLIAILSYTKIFFNPFLLGGQAYGTFGNQNYLASFLISTGPFILMWEKKLWRWVAISIVVLALILTGSRSSWIAAAVALFGVGLILYRQHSSKVFMVGVVSVVIVSAALLVGTLWHSKMPILKRFSFQGNEKQSAVTRLAIWKASARLIVANPIIGYGQDNLKDAIYPYLPKSITQSGSRSYVDRVHSEPFDILASGGLLSFVGYLGLFFFVLNKIIRDGRTTSPIESMVFFSLVALFCYHLVNFSTITSNIMWYIALGYLLSTTIVTKETFIVEASKKVYTYDIN